VEDSGDRQTCVKHELCSKELDDDKLCENLVLPGNYLCEEHNFLMCSAIVKKNKKKGQQCDKAAISTVIPYCKEHEQLHRPPPEAKPILRAQQTKQCVHMKARGGQCRGNPIVGMKYCRDHLHLYGELKAAEETIFSPTLPEASDEREKLLGEKEAELTPTPLADTQQTAYLDNSNSASNKPPVNDAEQTRVPSRDLTCVICLELYDDSRMLHCGHSFCFGCLAKLKKLVLVSFSSSSSSSSVSLSSSSLSSSSSSSSSSSFSSASSASSSSSSSSSSSAFASTPSFFFLSFFFFYCFFFFLLRLLLLLFLFLLLLLRLLLALLLLFPLSYPQECPECRKPIDGPVENLPKNFAVERLVASSKEDKANTTDATDATPGTFNQYIFISCLTLFFSLCCFTFGLFLICLCSLR
jgi:hypothetical protein